jgi:hypothetical protein
MKDAKGHGSDPRGQAAAHSTGVDQVGRPLYHGSNADFTSFELGHGYSSASKNGVWLADKPEMAEEYANIMSRYSGSPKIYETTISGNIGTEAHWNAAEKSVGPRDRSTAEGSRLHTVNTIQHLKNAGYDGIRFGDTVMMFDPGKIKITGKRNLK